MKNKYSEEELERIIEKELKQGKTYTDIARVINKSTVYIGKIKALLIEKGRITNEEIEKAKLERKKNFLMTDLRMNEIMKYLKMGLLQADIARLLKCSENTIASIIKNFKKHGLITQEEIDRARQEYMQELKGKDSKRNRVLEQLREGRLKADFALELGISKTNAKLIQNSLINEGRITQTEIDEAVESKGTRAQKRKKVVELLKQGYTYREVTQEIGYSNQIIAQIKSKAIANGELTEEEYQQAKKERRIRLKSASKEPQKENTQIEEQVRDLLLKGKDIRFIRKKTGQCNANIQDIIRKLIKEGNITQSEINDARNAATKEAEQKILMGLRKGYSHRKIVEMFEEGEYSTAYVRARIEELKQRGEITDEEIQKYKNQAEQAKKALKEMALSAKKQEKKQRAELHQSIIQENKKRKEDEFIKLLLQGLSVEEIGERIGCLKQTVYIYMTRLRKQGKIPDDEIKQARKQRSEEQKKIKNYKSSLDIAVKIVHEAETYTSTQINQVVQKIIDMADEMQSKGMLRVEEIQIISAALFQAEEFDINNILGIARLYLREKEYQESIDTLNYSRQFLNKEEEFKRVNEALKMIAAYKEKMERKKKAEPINHGSQPNLVDSQGDDEFPDI